ncbi:MAG: glycosyltransferase [Lachnospiraceae bacterium]|nr:glycosyltransferase [Lachnospiraceae bacterium]
MKEFEEKLVSIVVPVYNAQDFIGETIQYVKAQTYEHWELLLVDDCSLDNSCNIIEEMQRTDDRIKLIRQERNSGAASCRNKGVGCARGRYLCFLDADDIWEPDKLARELAFMDDGRGFVFTGYEFADENGQGLGKIVHVPETITYREALKNTTIFTSTVMIDRTIIADNDSMMPCIESEDTATWWNILKKYGTGYGLDECLVRYRRSAGTLSSNKFQAIKRIWNLYRKHERLSVVKSFYCMVFWAFRAVFRRI